MRTTTPSSLSKPPPEPVHHQGRTPLRCPLLTQSGHEWLRIAAVQIDALSPSRSMQLGPRVLRDRVLLQRGHLGPWRWLLPSSRNRLSLGGLAEEEATDSAKRRAFWH